VEINHPVWERPLLQAADRLAIAVFYADKALLEDGLKQAADDYIAVREEWSASKPPESREEP